jgi:hypothetical protein
LVGVRLYCTLTDGCSDITAATVLEVEALAAADPNAGVPIDADDASGISAVVESVDW